MLAMVPGHHGRLWFDGAYLSRHILFLGGIGTGKSNAMYQLLHPLRRSAGEMTSSSSSIRRVTSWRGSTVTATPLSPAPPARTRAE